MLRFIGIPANGSHVLSIVSSGEKHIVNVRESSLENIIFFELKSITSTLKIWYRIYYNPELKSQFKSTNKNHDIIT